MTDQTTKELQDEIDSLRVDLQGREDELQRSMEENTRQQATIDQLIGRISRLEDAWKSMREETSQDSGVVTGLSSVSQMAGLKQEAIGGDWTPPRSIMKKNHSWTPQAQSTTIKGDTTPPVEAIVELTKPAETASEVGKGEELGRETGGAAATKEAPGSIKRDQQIAEEKQLLGRLGPTKRSSRPRIVPDRFGGKQPWIDYREHFESCKLANGWDDEEAAVFLSASLQGPALKVLLHHGEGEKKRHSYSELLELLNGRFGPGERAENFLLELRNRRQKPKETIQELGQVIRELASFAYPEFTETARDRLARGHFSDAITSQSIREGIFRTKPTTLDEAIRAALATENFEKIEAQRGGSKFNNGKCRMLDDTSEGVAQPAPEQRTGEPKRRRDTRMYRFRERRPATQGDQCYRCQGHGHFARDCPEGRNKPRRQGNDGQPVLRPEEGLESRQGQPSI